MLANLLQTSSIKASAEAAASGLRIALFLEEESGNWHVRRLAEAMRARGAFVVVSSLPRCAFDTQLDSGIDIPGFDGAAAGRRVRALDLAGHAGADHVPPRPPACPARKRRARVERCARDRALRRQVGDDVPAAARPASRHRARAPWKTKPPADAYVADAGRPLIFKPLFGSQGKGLLRVDDASDLPAPEAADNIYYLQDFVPPSGATFRGLARDRHAQPRRRRHDAPSRHLDHQRAPGRRRRARTSRREEMAQLASRRACRRRCRLCRRRSHPHARRAAAGARGEQQPLLARAAERLRQSTSPRRSPRTSWRAVAEHRAA